MSNFQITEKRKILNLLQNHGGTCFIQRSNRQDEVWFIESNTDDMDKFISRVKAVSPAQILTDSGTTLFIYGIKLANEPYQVDAELTIRAKEVC